MSQLPTDANLSLVQEHGIIPSGKLYRLVGILLLVLHTRELHSLRVKIDQDAALDHVGGPVLMRERKNMPQLPLFLWKIFALLFIASDADEAL